MFEHARILLASVRHMLRLRYQCKTSKVERALAYAETLDVLKTDL